MMVYRSLEAVRKVLYLVDIEATVSTENGVALFSSSLDRMRVIAAVVQV